MEFKYEKLKRYAKLINGFAYKSGDYIDFGIPIVKIKNIVPPNIDLEGCNYVSENVYESTKEYALKNGDILISMTGSGVNQMSSAVGKVGRVKFNQKALQNQRVGKFEIIDENKYNYDFLYYYLSQRKLLEYFVTNSTGSANQANISKTLIEDTLIPDVKIDIQNVISKILLAYDKKIETNNKIIANLEAQAQALFKYYFIDFEPFADGNFVGSELGLIPEGWEIIKLGDKYPLKSGFAFKSKDLVGSEYPVIKIKNIEKGSINLSDADYINDEKISEKASEFFVDGSEIIIALTGATTGKFGIVPKLSRAYVNQRAGLFKNNNNGYGYLLGLLKQKDILNKIVGMARGSAQSNLSPKDVNDFRIPYYEDEKTRKINNMLNLYVEKISLLQHQNQTLAQTRDALLPKLMAGEIDLENIGGAYD